MSTGTVAIFFREQEEQERLARVLRLQIQSAQAAYGKCLLCGSFPSQPHELACPYTTLQQVERSAAVTSEEAGSAPADAGNASAAQALLSAREVGFLEPWQVEEDGCIFAGQSMLVFDPIGSDLPDEEAVRFARRIAACVNFCAEIPTEELTRGEGQ